MEESSFDDGGLLGRPATARQGHLVQQRLVERGEHRHRQVRRQDRRLPGAPHPEGHAPQHGRTPPHPGAWCRAVFTPGASPASRGCLATQIVPSARDKYLRLRRRHRAASSPAGHRRARRLPPGGPPQDLRLVQRDDGLRRSRLRRRPGPGRSRDPRVCGREGRGPQGVSPGDIVMRRRRRRRRGVALRGVRAFVLLLAVAGNETTAIAIATACRRSSTTRSSGVAESARRPRRTRSCAGGRRCRCSSAPLPRTPRWADSHRRGSAGRPAVRVGELRRDGLRRAEPGSTSPRPRTCTSGSAGAACSARACTCIQAEIDLMFNKIADNILDIKPAGSPAPAWVG